jgi:hypothetical protein
MNRDKLRVALVADYEMVKQECPDDVAGSYRNRDETMVLGMFKTDERRIEFLGQLASIGKVDPDNALFFYDTAIHFTDPTKAKDAQMVAQYEQVPNKGFGRAERLLRRTFHPRIRKFVQ